MKTYKVEFEFNTGYNPAEWDWPTLLMSLDDGDVRVDLESVKIFAQDWNLIAKGA